MLAALDSAAGVYIQVPVNANEHLVKQLNRTVLITAINSGYLEHLLNFDCFMKRLGLKYVVFSLDPQMHERYCTIMKSTMIRLMNIPCPPAFASIPFHFFPQSSFMLTKYHAFLLLRGAFHPIHMSIYMSMHFIDTVSTYINSR